MFPSLSSDQINFDFHSFCWNFSIRFSTSGETVLRFYFTTCLYSHTLYFKDWENEVGTKTFPSTYLETSKHRSLVFRRYSEFSSLQSNYSWLGLTLDYKFITVYAWRRNDEIFPLIHDYIYIRTRIVEEFIQMSTVCSGFGRYPRIIRLYGGERLCL